MAEDSATEIPADIKNAMAFQKAKVQKGTLFESAANLIIAYILALFIVLGYVSITLERAADQEIIFLWRYFNPATWATISDSFVPSVAFAVIMFFLGYTEKIYPAARWKSLIVVGLLITSAILFHQGIHDDTISIALFFGSWEGYLTLMALVMGALIFSFLGNQTRLFVFSKKKKEIEYLKHLTKEGHDADRKELARNDE